RREVVLRRDALDRVAELVDIEDPVAQQHERERVDAGLPVGVERRAVVIHRHRPEPALASPVVGSAHGNDANPRSTVRKARHVWLAGTMAEDLENLTSKELHDRAVGRAVHRLDVAFLWRLLRAIPAAEAATGHPDQAEADVSHLSAIINELVHS